MSRGILEIKDLRKEQNKTKSQYLSIFLLENFVHNKRHSDSPGSGKLFLTVLCSFGTYSKVTKELG